MAAKSKSVKIRGAAHRPAAQPPRRHGRATAKWSDAWEQTAQLPDARDDEIDCQRIVEGDGGRHLPLYYDDYN